MALSGRRRGRRGKQLKEPVGFVNGLVGHPSWAMANRRPRHPEARKQVILGPGRPKAMLMCHDARGLPLSLCR